MKIEVGKCYYRNANGRATVRKVLALCDGKVEYERLHGPTIHNKHARPSTTPGRYGSQGIRNFARWAKDVVEELSDYKHLDGCVHHDTFVVRNTQGEPILRCSIKRAKFYLKRGYVTEVEPGVLQFTNDVTETRLRELYDNTFSEFFMEVKNDHCVCCNGTKALTKHHVVPIRCLKSLPQPWRSCISNILFVCMRCHLTYEQYILKHGEPDIVLGDDPLQYARAWRDHFLSIMKPGFIPKGWDIVTVKNTDAARKYYGGLKSASDRDESSCQAESA